MVNKRHMQKMMRQVLRESETAINNKVKVKKLNIHKYTEILLAEICRRTRAYTKEMDRQIQLRAEKETTTSSNVLQEVLDDLFQEETLQAQSSSEEPLMIIKEPLQESSEEPLEEPIDM